MLAADATYTKAHVRKIEALLAMKRPDKALYHGALAAEHVPATSSFQDLMKRCRINAVRQAEADEQLAEYNRALGEDGLLQQLGRW